MFNLHNKFSPKIGVQLDRFDAIISIGGGFNCLDQIWVCLDA